MTDKFFLTAPGATAGVAAGTRVLWSGRCAVAEYAFEEPSSLPRWTLPEETEVFVTDDRVIYRDVTTGATGELRWAWPQHLRVQPGNRDTGRSATVTQIQLVCAGPGSTFPALVFAGGELTTVGDADRLANVLRQAIARFRVENAAQLGITAPQARMLSRLVIGPEFSNYQGGEGQTVSLLGSVPLAQAPTYVEAPVPPSVYDLGSFDDEPFLDPYRPGTPLPGSVPAATIPGYAAPYDGSGYAPLEETAPSWPMAGRAEFGVTPPQQLRPGFDETVHTRPARPADEATLLGAPDLESRAADLAARVANLVSGGDAFDQHLAAETTNLRAYLNTPGEPVGRAEQVRRTAARLAGNAARTRSVSQPRPADDEIGSSTRKI